MASPPDTQTQREPNRLGDQTSPYLRQHAFNPVDWWPWGEEAFAEARRRGVPIFLSVGYSTCYWCHVMERESFEDEAIASIMNERFVCVKVDREERPDVDDIYMAAVQLLTRRGGWPMSVWMTPPGARGEDDAGLEPFYAGTYFPAEERGGMVAFPQVLMGISEAWTGQREQVLEQAKQVTEGVRSMLGERAAPTPVGSEQVGAALGQLVQMYDREHGGFGQAPKFPQPVFVEFLLDALPTVEDPAVRSSLTRAVRHTLDRMAMGGMYDQVGGGFHRYSVDERWLVPHFEKMLYDNGQLASLYARSYARVGDEGGDAYDAEIIRETLDYVLREMTAPEGGFYSAQDAEVNTREGENYLWTSEQLTEVLGEEDAVFAAKVYGVADGPNFQDPHHPEDAPTNVLFLASRPERVAEGMGLSPGAFEDRLGGVNQRMYQARMQRDQPGLDDKILAGWNGLMIRGMADGGRVLGEPGYIEHAERAAAFVLGSMRDGDGGLLRTAHSGVAKTPAFLEDYAFMASALVALHDAREALGMDRGSHLEDASALIDDAFARFEDPGMPGLLHDTLAGQSDLIVRTRSTYDGAVPTGQSVMLNTLVSLAERTGDGATLQRAREVLAATSGAISESPLATVNATRALHRMLQSGAVADAGPSQRREDDDRVFVDRDPVEVFAATDRVSVKPGEPATIAIEIRISEGFHITASDPGVEGLVPLSVRIDGGAGVAASAVFPEPEVYDGSALPPEDKGTLRVHTGTFRGTITLERTEEVWAGRPIITLTYQACDDSACFQPITLELDVAIDQ